MLILMEDRASKAQVGAVLTRLKAENLSPRLITTPVRTVIGLVEELEPGLAASLREELPGLPGLAAIEDFGTSAKLASRQFKAEDTVIRVFNRAIGGPEPVVMAGPCAVESLDQILTIARAAAKAGAGFLRGGAFKPRTSPYSFRGLGEPGLECLARARQETGLAVVTEVLRPKDVDLVARYADILQIGSRNMQNFALLEAAGDQDKPVFLKRGLMSTVKELLLSAEYILARGNGQVILCERGIRTFEPGTRNTLDISAVPRLKQESHLPVIVDPSHAAGFRELVPALALAALAAGADGVMVEVHPEPDQAASDGRQSLTLEQFDGLMGRIRLSRAV